MAPKTKMQKMNCELDLKMIVKSSMKLSQGLNMVPRPVAAEKRNMTSI